MTNIVLKPETGKIFISPLGFLIYAEDFLKAYNKYDIDKSFTPVPYYLVCRSIELSLKGFLIAKGIKKNDLKSNNLGHDLKKVLAEAIKKDLNSICLISDKQKQEIEKANNWYQRKGFEYFDLQNIIDGTKTLPNLKVLETVANKLISNLKPFCLNIA